MKFIMLINVKMPTIVVILTFISKINTISAGKIINFQYFTFYLYEESLIISGPDLDLNCLQRLSADDARGKELIDPRGCFQIGLLGFLINNLKF